MFGKFIIEILFLNEGYISLKNIPVIKQAKIISNEINPLKIRSVICIESSY